MIGNQPLFYTDIRKSFPVNDSDGNGTAFFTHYLHNRENGVSKHFREQASDFLRHITPGLFSSAVRSLDEIRPIHWDIPFPAQDFPEFTFIDLFAGIGGFRIPLQELGGKCVFSSEYNRYAKESYELNFGEIPFGDLTELDISIIPKHDILCAGFPCQPFSISGKMRGFEDTRGTLIYYVFKIIAEKKPRVVLLENVKHLLHHDGKRTLSTILQHLEELGYKAEFRVLNAADYGVPQNRERLIIVCHRNIRFDFSDITTQSRPVLRDFLETDREFEYLNEPYTLLEEPRTQESGLIFAGYRNKRIRHAGVRPGTEHLSRVHKQPNRIYSSEGIHPALPSQEPSGRFWIFHQGRVRKLTIEECYRIMGFPQKFRLINRRSELYKQIGNSVSIPMINAVGEQIKQQLL